MVPNTGPYDAQVNTEAVSTLFSKIGPGILVTHSQSGGLGWRTAIKNRNVRASVSFEPGFDFPFPEGDVPPPMTLGGRALRSEERRVGKEGRCGWELCHEKTKGQMADM